jgi:hypothetical protein
MGSGKKRMSGSAKQSVCSDSEYLYAVLSMSEVPMVGFEPAIFEHTLGFAA